MQEIINIIFKIPAAYAQVATAGEVASETQGQITQLVGTVISRIPLWITALFVIILTFVIARIVKSSVENRMAKEGFEEEHKELSIVAGRSANAIVLIIGITAGLKIAGIDLTTIIAAGAFGIGFALKDLIMNFIAGVMILTARHYAIGDIIKVKGILGRIEEIQSRATVVKNFDGTKVVIPNAELFKNPVTSFTSNPFRRAEIIVGVEYGSDLKKTLEACLKAASESKNVLVEPKPSAGIFEFGPSSINVKVKAWVESSKGVIKTKSSMIQNIKKELDAVGINIPFPIQTIVFDEDMKREREEGEKISEEEEVDQLIEEEASRPVEQQAENEPEAEVQEAELQEEKKPSQEAPPQWLEKAAEETAPAIEEQPQQPQQEAQPEVQPSSQQPPAAGQPQTGQEQVQPQPQQNQQPSQ